LLTNDQLDEIVREFFIKEQKGNIGILKKNRISMKVKVKKKKIKRRMTFSMILFVWQII